MGTQTEAGRSFSLTVSILIFVYHATAAYACTYLPSDPLYVSVSVTGYAWYGCTMSLLGVVGSLKRSPVLLTIFSNHLLIDTILSIVPKIGVLFLFHDMTSDLCFGSSAPSSLPSPYHVQNTFWIPSDASSLHGPGRVIITSSSSSMSSRHSNGFVNKAYSLPSCDISLSIARLALLAFLGLWTTAQWGLGLYIRRYAAGMEILFERSGVSLPLVGGDRDVEKAVSS